MASTQPNVDAILKCNECARTIAGKHVVHVNFKSGDKVATYCSDCEAAPRGEALALYFTKPPFEYNKIGTCIDFLAKLLERSKKLLPAQRTPTSVSEGEKEVVKEFSQELFDEFMLVTRDALAFSVAENIYCWDIIAIAFNTMITSKLSANALLDPEITLGLLESLKASWMHLQKLHSPYIHMLHSIALRQHGMASDAAYARLDTVMNNFTVDQQKHIYCVYGQFSETLGDSNIARVCYKHAGELGDTVAMYLYSRLVQHPEEIATARQAMDSMKQAVSNDQLLVVDDNQQLQHAMSQLAQTSLDEGLLLPHTKTPSIALDLLRDFYGPAIEKIPEYHILRGVETLHSQGLEQAALYMENQPTPDADPLNLCLMASLLYTLEDHKRAIEIYDGIFSSSKKNLLLPIDACKHLRKYADSLINVGLYKNAAEILCKCLAIGQKFQIFDSSAYIQLLFVLLCVGDWDVFAVILCIFVARSDNFLSSLFSTSSDQERLFQFSKFWNDMCELPIMVMLFPNKHPESDKMCTVLVDLILRRKALTTAFLFKFKQYLHTNPSTTLDVSAEISSLFDDTTKELQQRNKMELQVIQKIPQTSLSIDISAINVPAILARLDSNTVLLEYISWPADDHEEYGVAVFCGRTKRCVFMQFKSGEQLHQMISEYLEHVQQGRGGARDCQYRAVTEVTRLDENFEPIESENTKAINLGMKIYQILVKDVLDGLSTKPSHLIISPDKGLSLLPFYVLPISNVNDKPRYLIHEYTVSYLTSGRELLLQERAKSSPSAPVVFADPNFDLGCDEPLSTSDSDKPFPFKSMERMPGMRKEGEAMAKILGVELISGDAATSTNFFEKLKGTNKGSPYIVHAATHACYVKKPPATNQPDYKAMNQAGIMFAGINAVLAGKVLPESYGKGYVTAEETAALWLGETELMVCAGCQTGLGTVKPGEGILGFTRLFRCAGVRTVISSFWSVLDLQTANLMTSFYTKLRAGEGRAQALRNAMLALLEVEPAPRAWGAFSCIGDIGPLEL